MTNLSREQGALDDDEHALEVKTGLEPELIEGLARRQLSIADLDSTGNMRLWLRERYS
jgi:hypothetical protein